MTLAARIVTLEQRSRTAAAAEGSDARDRLFARLTHLALAWRNRPPKVLADAPRAVPIALALDQGRSGEALAMIRESAERLRAERASWKTFRRVKGAPLSYGA